jgi:hypothetical protein
LQPRKDAYSEKYHDGAGDITREYNMIPDAWLHAKLL